MLRAREGVFVLHCLTSMRIIFHYFKANFGLVGAYVCGVCVCVGGGGGGGG